MLPQKFTICALENKDILALLELEEACFFSCWAATQYEQFIDSGMAFGKTPLQALAQGENMAPRGFVFGQFTAQGNLAGYVSFLMQHALKEIEIFNVATAHSFRRKGLARQLLTTILKAAQHHGITRTILEVRETNTAALALYAQLGFSQKAHRKNYYADTGEDALLLAFEPSSMETEL